MLRQPKYQSILAFVLCLLSVVLALQLLPPSDLLRWHISVMDYSPTNYRIEITSPTLAVYQQLRDDYFPYSNLNVYSPKGECMEGHAQWRISSNDLLKEQRVLDLFSWGVPLAFLSLGMLVLASVNVLWRWWERRAEIIFFSLVLCVTGLFLMRALGPHGSVQPDWSNIDFDCISSVVIKAQLISINQQALYLFVALSLLITLIELIAVMIVIRPLC